MARRKKVKVDKPIQMIVLVILVVVAVYLYFQNPQDEPEITYSASQNTEGFYYYTDVPDGTYYSSANQLTANTLLLELRSIINEDVTRRSYDEVRYDLETVDLMLDSTTELYGVYDNALLNATWDGGATWNREHVWPNSRLGMDRVDGYERNQATDLHNLRASTPSVNSSKSDRFFSEGTGIEDITPDGGYYPGDEQIGDVARIIFYMAVMYDFLDFTDDNLFDETDHYTMDGARMGKKSVLLEWHKLDPVDDFERARNDRIQAIQGNRNPFIDKPEYAHLIWESKTMNELVEPETTWQSLPFLTQMSISDWMKRYV